MKRLGIEARLGIAALLVGVILFTTGQIHTGRTTVPSLTVTTGPVLLPNGSASAPSLATASDASQGLFFSISSGGPVLVSNGGQRFVWADPALGTRLGVLGLRVTATAEVAGDSVLERSAANTLGTNIGGAATSSLASVGGTLNVTTTAVGNVGAGPDDLMTYTLPASALSATGKGVRIIARGTTANNANAKTVSLRWGSQTILSTALTVSIAGQWETTAEIFRTGSNTQRCYARLLQGATVIVDQEITACTQTDTSAIIVKNVADTVTANNDIVQELLLVEFFN